MFLCVSTAPRAPDTAAAANGHIGLIQKDADFHIVPGGASGDVWFAPAAPTFAFHLAARGLRPDVHYLIELNVDDATYELTSRAADARGTITLDTTLTRFETGACIGGEYVAPRSLRGTHHVKFLVKRDGNPPSGTRRTHSSSITPPDLPCHGNGDENFSYALFEDNVAQYTGTR
jgi:hypothetical protein